MSRKFKRQISNKINKLLKLYFFYFVNRNTFFKKTVTSKDKATDPIQVSDLKTPPTEALKLRKKNNDEEAERKLRERMPIEYKSLLKNAKIDTKTLINRSPVDKHDDQNKKKSTQPRSPTIKFESRNVIKKPSNTSSQKKANVAIKDIKLTGQSRQSSLSSDEDANFSTKNVQRKKIFKAKPSDIKKLKKKKTYKEKKPGEKHSRESSDEQELDNNENEEAIINNNEIDSIYNSKNRKTYQESVQIQKSKKTKKTPLQPVEEMRDTKSDLRNIESVEPEDSGRSQSSKKALARSINSTDMSHRFSSASENWDQYSSKNNEHKKPKFRKITYTEDELKQINNLFSFFYGVNGPPKRIRSANYNSISQLPTLSEVENVKKSLKEVKSDKINELKKTNEEVHIEKIIEKKNESNKTVFNYFDNIIENFEKKRYQFDSRIKSAQIRRENLKEESLRKWSASIEKKKASIPKPTEKLNLSKKKLKPISNYAFSRPNSINLIDITYDEQSILNRQTKSATILRRIKTLNKRPKSVTFTDDVNSNENKLESELELDTEIELKQAVLEQEPYLVSAIEMEEILEAAAARAMARPRSRSSVTTIPNIYLNQLQNIKNKVPTNKQQNDNIQESLERYSSATSVTDTSATDNEMYSESDYIFTSQQFGRSSYLSSNTKLSGKITSSTLTFDSQGNNSQGKNMRINSCIVDYRRGSAKKNLSDKFESLSNYRYVDNF